MRESSVEELLSHRRDAACVYVQRRLVEACPARGSLTRDQAWLFLLHQARDIYHEAMGTAEFAEAHGEIPVREVIFLSEARGDLERADVDRSGNAHAFRADRRRLKKVLFRALIAQARAMRDRRDGDEWWFPSELPDALAKSTAATGELPTAAIAELPEPQSTTGSAADPLHSRRRPGRKPKRITDSYRLVAEYQLRLETLLSQTAEQRHKPTKANLSRALAISEDLLYLFQRESLLLGRKTRDSIQNELTTGPTEKIIAYFCSPELAEA
jgi:hypothetical protein